MRFSAFRMGVVAAVLSSVLMGAAHAASINYGNFNAPPSGVSFLSVTESSGTDPVPLFGPPTPFVIGLDFNPTSFVSTASGGASDITDGQLNFTVTGNKTVGIKTLGILEAGDYTLAGTGTAATTAYAGAIIRATVTEIDGLPVAPIVLAPSNASVGFAMPPVAIAAPWSLGITSNLDAQLLGLGYHPTIGITKVDIAINNTLVTTSETSSISFIAKKEFQVTITTGQVPEPASLSIAGAFALLLNRRRRAV